MATAAAMSMLYLKSAIAGTVSCRALNLEGFGYSVFTIDGEQCRTVQGTPCWIGFNHRITLRGGGNCEGTVYWVSSFSIQTVWAFKSLNEAFRRMRRTQDCILISLLDG